MNTNLQIKTGGKVLHPELSYILNGILYKIHNSLGRFCKEKQYSDANVKVAENKADFIIEDKILIEVKAKPFITQEDYYQTLRYLKTANLKLALLTNFRNRYLRIRRILN